MCYGHKGFQQHLVSMAVCVAVAHFGKGIAVLCGCLVLVVHVLHACNGEINLSARLQPGTGKMCKDCSLQQCLSLRLRRSPKGRSAESGIKYEQ